MNNPAYYLEYEDGLGPYWKCFDGNDGQCMSTQRTKQDAMSWCRGWNHILLGEIGHPHLSHRQWKKWFPGYPNSKHIYNAYKMDYLMYDSVNTFASLPEVKCSVVSSPYLDGDSFSKIMRKQEEGNNPMYLDDCVTVSPWPTTTKKCGQPQAATQSVIQVITDSKPDTAVHQRSFLTSRVHDLKYVKYNEISEQFFKNEPNGPKTVAELKERLKKGHYTVELPKGFGYDSEDDEIYWRDAFSWRTPETQFDKAGWEAAYKELTTFVSDILDQIAILDPKEGLALLDDLKKWKPSKTKK